MTKQLIQWMWIAQLAFLSLLTVVLIAKRVWRSFPLFTAYSVFNFLSGIVAFFVHRQPNVYLYVFIIEEIVSVVLALAVLYEVFAHLFSVHPALRKLATYLLYAAMVVLAALGFSLIYVHGPGGLKTVISAVSTTEEAARVFEVGLLIFLFISSRAFGLHWRQQVFGVALGMGFFTTVELAVMTVWVHIINSSSTPILSIISMFAFNLSLLIWTGYLAAPEKVTASGTIPDRSQLEQWNRAVMELIHQ